MEEPFRFNIMLAGSKGLGKTTFFNNFINKSILDQKINREIINNICNISVEKMEINESNFVVKMDLVEVDGIGDHVDNKKCSEPIINLLKDRFNDYLYQFENKIKRLIDDLRIHVCLYFIEPIPFLKQADIDVIKDISKYCNVIPIIGKADMMTEEELHYLKEEITNKIRDTDIFYMSCNKNLSDIREYNWGTVERQSFDFYKLRGVLLEKNTKDLIDETEFLYDQYRMNILAEELFEDKEFLSVFSEQNEEIEAIKQRIAGKRELLNGS